MPEGKLVLLVDDEECSRELLAAELEELGLQVVTARSGDEGWNAFQRRRFHLVVTDLRMPGADGMELLRRLRSGASPQPHVPVILVSARGTLSTAVDAGRSGATDFYPLDERGISELVGRIRELVSAGSVVLPDVLHGKSRAIRAVRDRIAAVARVHAPVLISGPEGAGHGSVATFLHQLGEYATHSFVQARLEQGSELPRLPASGSIWIENVERLAVHAQRELLRLLETTKIQRGSESLRVIASSSADLSILRDEGTFAADLTDRLCRFEVRLPGLSERSEDIAELLEVFLDRCGARLGRRIPCVQPQAVRAFSQHVWARGFRDFEIAVESLIAFSPDGTVTEESALQALSNVNSPLERISQRRRQREREQLLDLFEKHGSFSGVARELGITRNAAKYRLAKHRLIPQGPLRQT
jgi:DNA-binding NtrC family response regulator